MYYFTEDPGLAELGSIKVRELYCVSITYTAFLYEFFTFMLWIEHFDVSSKQTWDLFTYGKPRFETLFNASSNHRGSANVK